MALSYQLVDARTGVIRAEVPRLKTQQACAVTMGKYEPLSADVPYPKSVLAYANTGSGKDAAVAALADFKAATRAGANVLIALDEDRTPIWGGLVLVRTRDHGPTVRLDCATAEAYFDRRYVGTYAGTGIDQNQVFADLVDLFIADGTLPGLPIRIVNTASAQTQTVNFDATTDDQTIGAIAQQLAGVVGGIRWTIAWERQSSPERITPVLYVADRLGSAKRTDLPSANAMFSMPGNVQAFQVIEDYTTGKGANIVTANGPGQAGTREVETVYPTDYAGRPAFEQRWQPQVSTGSIQLTLAQHATAAEAILFDGSKVVTMTARARSTARVKVPKVGTDYHIGDDIGYDLWAPGVIDGELQNGVGQCIGWSRDDNVQTPVMVAPDATAA